MKKSFSLMLVALMSISVLSGCKAKEAAVTTPEVASGSGPSWTWDTSPYTISAFVAIEGRSVKWDVTKDAMKALTDETGISLDVQSGNADKLNALMAAGNLPDVVVLDTVTSPLRKQLETAKKVYAYDDLITKYAPDFKVVESMQDWYRNADGHFYGYASFFGAPEDFETYPGVALLAFHNSFLARQDLMTKVGVKASDFATKDGMITALKKVKDAKLTFNGADVLPFAMTAGNVSAYNWSQFFGTPTEDKDGNMLDTRKQPQYLEAIAFLNRMYNEGLISEEQFTSNRDQIDRKVKTGNVFALSDDFSGGETAATRAIDPEAYMVPIQVPKSDSGTSPAIEAVSTLGWTWQAITKDCKKPDRVIRWMDYMASHEGQMLTFFGVEGKQYDLVNDRVVNKPEYEAERVKDLTAAESKVGIGYWAWMMNWAGTYNVFGPDPKATKEGQIGDAQYQGFYKYAYDNRTLVDTIPDPGSDLLGKQIKIKQYWDQEEVKMIRSKSEAEAKSIYNAAVIKIDQMGDKEVFAFQNTKFQENKKKIGVKFVFPTNK